MHQFSIQKSKFFFCYLLLRITLENLKKIRICLFFLTVPWFPANSLLCALICYSLHTCKAGNIHRSLWNIMLAIGPSQSWGTITGKGTIMLLTCTPTFKETRQIIKWVQQKGKTLPDKIFFYPPLHGFGSHKDCWCSRQVKLLPVGKYPDSHVQIPWNQKMFWLYKGN